MKNGKRRSGVVIMVRLLQLVRPLVPFMLIAILTGVLGFLCATFITIFGGYAILDILASQGAIAYEPVLGLTAIFVSVAVFAVLRGVLRYCEQSCNHYLAFKLLAMIRDKIFGALRRLCPAKLEGKDRGNLIGLITSDTELLEVFYAHTISPIAIALIMSVIMSAFIGSYHWALGLIAALGYFVVGVIIPMASTRIGGDRGLNFRMEMGDLNSCVLDSIRGLKESQQYGTGEKRLEEINSRTDSLLKKDAVLKRNAGINAAVTNGVILLFSTAVLLAAILLYRNNQLGFDGVLIATIAMMGSFGPVVALANLGNTLQQTFAAGNRVMDILDENPEVEEVTDGQNIQFYGLECENVDFSYGSEPILRDMSLTVPKNKVIGITGRSGSGKSTLLKLMMRFWDVEGGKIRISGTDIRRINTTSLRGMESFVTQETYLFRDSIEENIRLAKPDATHEEVVAACKKASVHDFIMTLPQGYDTPVGELGDTLSDGEKQRIGLARAFLHDADLILLDEPTSNLDSLNEGVILKSLNEERGNKTVVLVSHRASTMKIADQVYSVENGRMS
mgnify:FL=1